MTITELKLNDELVINHHNYTYSGIEKRSSRTAKIEYFVFKSSCGKFEKLFERHNKNILKHNITENEDSKYIW